MNPLDLVSAAPWKNVAFTTYALSLSFFEAVILDRLVRGGSRSALILTDPEGVRAGLSEEGARRAGRDYDIEPVGCTTGAFHPKVSMFASDDDVHLLVGSGNLTFGGWGGNMEVVEHLHPSFAADALADAADMFELLALSDYIRTEAGHSFVKLADKIRAANRNASKTGAVRLLYSVGGSVGAIGSEISKFADELGGAQKVTIVSPYYELNGRGVDTLADLLSCHNVQLHVHKHGCVSGTGAVSWPFNGTRKRQPVEVPVPFKADGRLLHAKSIEILCKRGRLLVAGSANSTHAGLFGANVEASVLRVQRQVLKGWETSEVNTPRRLEAHVTEETDAPTENIGVLRASLENGVIKATVITPKVRGRAKVLVRTVRKSIELGYVEITASGNLTIAAQGLEQDAWEVGRLVLRLEQHGTAVEGFVGISAATELVRQAGPIASRIFAVLAGNETPADVAAMLAWFREDPNRLPRMSKEASASGGAGKDLTPNFVSLVSLNGSSKNIHPGEAGNGSAAWKSAMGLLRLAFSTPRGPLSSELAKDDDDNDNDNNVNADANTKRAQEVERQNTKSLAYFEDLLPKMLDPDSTGSDPDLALTLTHFVADRIRPPAAKIRAWISRILPAIRSFDDRGLATLLVHYGTDGAPNKAVRARRAFLRRDVALEALTPSLFDTIPAFVDALSQDFDPSDFIDKVNCAKTGGEEVREYISAATVGPPVMSPVLLLKSIHWPKLRSALTNRELFDKFEVVAKRPSHCERCRMKLPSDSSSDLLKLGVTACCNRLILCEEL